MKPTISPSKLDMYFRCGEQYRRRYIEREIIPPGVALVKGRAVHKASEVNFTQKISSREDLPVDVLTDAAAQEVDVVVAGEGIALTPEETGRGVARVKDEIRDRAVALARLLHKRIAPTIQPVLVERFVKLELPRHSHDLTGRLDLADEAGFIRDLKTASRSKNADEVAQSAQLTYYAAAYKRLMQKEPAGVTLEVLVDKARPAVQRLEATRTVADKRVFLNKINAMLAGLKAGVFLPAAPGSWACSPRYCGYWSTCPYVNAERKAAAQATEEERNA